MATVFDVVAEPTRRRMLDLLRERPRSVGELAGALDLSQPAASKHLRVLRETGLVRVRPDRQTRWYELAPAPLAELDAWLAPYRRMWRDSLDALAGHLDAMPDDPDDPDDPGEPDEPEAPEAPAEAGGPTTED